MRVKWRNASKMRKYHWKMILSHSKKGSNFIDVFQSLLSRFVVACSRPMKHWNDWKKAVPYAISGWCHSSKKKSSTRCWLKGKMGIFHLAYPWLMLWQNHDEFDGPSTVIYLATYPPNCPQKGQDGWDLSPIMRCESMLTFSFVCVTAHGSEYNCPHTSFYTQWCDKSWQHHH